MSINEIDTNLINFFKRTSLPIARFAIFLVYFWFGILKVVGMSPASPLVQALFEKTISFMSFDTFMVLFGIFECLIGILFLIPRLERVAMVALLAHMVTTFMPLIMVPEMTWSGFMVPTMEGQYIIKNILIISVAVTIGANLRPLAELNNR